MVGGAEWECVCVLYPRVNGEGGADYSLSNSVSLEQSCGCEVCCGSSPLPNYLQLSDFNSFYRLLVQDKEIERLK